jgi:Sulfotransferase family
LKPVTRLLRPYLLRARDHAWRATVGRLDPQAYEFYARMLAAGYDPAAHIDVLPDQRIIYVCVPKSASSRIKMSLSALLGRQLSSSEEANKRKRSGLKAPHHVGLSVFYRLAMDPNTLRFSFVRNPYSRLVSCWADKFQDKPLIPGDSFVDQYLAARDRIDLPLSARADKTLSFADFTRFVSDPLAQHINAHWQPQQKLVDGPAITLDFIGRVETFDSDFARVFDHLGASAEIRREALVPVNPSRHRHWSQHYTPDLADRIYRAYECDFDRFSYPRALPV